MHHGRHQDIREDVQDQLVRLSHEVAGLKKQMASRGRAAYRDTRHVGEDFADVMRDYMHNMPDMRQQAHRLQKSAQAHPATTASIAAASVIVLGLAASLFMRR
ncbi:hypothetical protein [Chelativorans sp. YIM 93263]|uniref:hypothetical protein n=1 Tax=Chelativorans sp. YIM 93263 TaxID=2906648 RepID=UPI0023783D73|nr:hypothetical protein [Chelativorans sp. YIM 93263]